MTADPRFQVLSDGDGRFSLMGEIDISVCDSLVDRLTPALHRGGDLTLDLSGLTFIDSSGISALIRIAKDLDGERTLVLSSPRGEVARVLDLVGIDRMPRLRILDGQSP